MVSTLDSFAKTLAEKPLYAPQRYFNTCQRLLRNSKRSLSAAAELIMLDPALCTLVLRHVNRTRSQSSHALAITSVTSALNLLGEEATLNLIGRVAVLEHKVKDVAITADYLQLLDRMLHTSFFAWHWAQQRGDSAPSEMRISGLLHGIGELALCAHHYKQYRQVQIEMRSARISQASAAHRVLGFSFAQLGEQLSRAWSLPEDISDSMCCQRYELYRPRGVMLAAECARQAELGWYHRDMFVCKQVIAEYLNQSVPHVCSDIHASALTLARQSVLHSPESFAARLVQMPGSHCRQSAPPAQVKKVKTTAASVAVAARNREADSKDKLRRAKIFAATVQKLKSSTANVNTSANDVVKALLFGLHQGVAVGRVAFAMFDTGGRSMSVKLARGMDAEQARRIPFPCVGHTLFASLMKAPKSVWINRDNFVKYQPLIPDSFSQQVLTDNFICTSLFCGRRPIGLIYVDCVNSGAPINDRSCQHVKSLVLFAGKALTLIDNERRAARKKRVSTIQKPVNTPPKISGSVPKGQPRSVKAMSDQLLQANQKASAPNHQ